MGRWLGVVIYANWIARLIWAAMIFVIWWAGIHVSLLPLKLQFLILAVVVLTIALTVTNVILSNIIETRYENEP